METIIHKQKTPIRKAYAVGTSWVVTIDPSLVKDLNINEETYFSEEIMDNAIMLRIRRLST